MVRRIAFGLPSIQSLLDDAAVTEGLRGSPAEFQLRLRSRRRRIARLWPTGQANRGPRQGIFQNDITPSAVPIRASADSLIDALVHRCHLAYVQFQWAQVKTARAR